MRWPAGRELGNFSTSFGIPDGQLYYLSQTRPGIWERFPFQLWPGNTRFGRFIKAFGEDEAGENYLLGTTVLDSTAHSGDPDKQLTPSAWAELSFDNP